MIALIRTALILATPLLLAASGGLLTELAGIMNIALEGLMLASAFFCALAAGLTGSLWMGVACGVVASMLLALLYGFVTLRLRANIFIAGLALNLLSPGLTAVLSLRWFGTKGVLRFPAFPRLPEWRIPLLDRLPVLGDLFNGLPGFVPLGWLAVGLTAVLLYRTPLGLRIRAAGLDPDTLVSLGLKPRRYQGAAILGSALACGLAGSFMALRLSAFVPYITAGKGWIALVAIYLGQRVPFGVFLACILFGLLESASNQAQGFLTIPNTLILTFPYLASLASLLIFSLFRSLRKRNTT